MRNLPLNNLRAFAAVYETGGVRPAARLLQIAHSAVSRHVKELEAWIGVPILEPRDGNRSLAFTAEGEALGRAALSSLRDLEAAAAKIREAKRGNSVTLSTTPSFAARWLLPRLGRFSEVNGWIELSIVVDQRQDEVSRKESDLRIRMGAGPWPDLICEPLMDDMLYPVMSPDYWHAARQPESPEDLVGLDLLHDRDPNASWEVWRTQFGPDVLDVRSGPRFTSSDLVLRAAAQGLGVALARDRLAQEDVASGVLVRPFGDAQVDLANAYWIVRSPDHTSRVAVDAVIGWLKNEAAGL